MQIIMEELVEIGRQSEIKAFFYKGKTEEELKQILRDLWEKTIKEEGVDMQKAIEEEWFENVVPYVECEGYCINFWIQDVAEVEK